MPTVTYRIDGAIRRCTAVSGTRLLRVSVRNTIPHAQVCGGNGLCSTCRVQVLAGADNLTPLTAAEQRIATAKQWPDDRRLACQAKVLGDVEVRPLLTGTDGGSRLADELLAERPGFQRDLAVMFCDIRAFTPFAEDNLPYDVVFVLNRFFQSIGDPILVNRGTIINYMGDGMLAVFGMRSTSPDEACMDAVRAGLRMLDEVDRFNAYVEKQFAHEFKVGIGLHYGPVIVGAVGHSSKRDLTALGTVVNIAARVESATKETNSRLLVTEAVRERVGDLLVGGRNFELPLRGVKGTHTLTETLGLRDDDPVFLVQTSYARLEGREEVFADRFYDTLFRRSPELEALFAETDMDRQRRMLMSTLDVAVRGLHQIEELLPILAELGARHVSYGVKSEDYDAVGGAIIEALGVELGDGFTSAVRSAWEGVFSTLVEAMLAGE